MTDAPRTSRAALVWTPNGPRRDATVVTVGARVTAVRPGAPTDGPVLDGLLVPGLVNAHTHLELTGVPLVPGDGLADWVRTLAATRASHPGGDAGAGAQALHRLGVAIVVDHSNGGDTATAVADAGLVGVVQHELLGHDPARTREGLATAHAGPRHHRGVTTRPTAHGAHSTAAAVIQAVVATGGPPASVHVAEHPDERAFLHGGGPFAELLARWGVDTSAFTPPHRSSVAYLHALGVLGPGLLAVHGVDIDDDDAQRLAATGTPLVLCPRSNQHIGDRLPPVDTLRRAGVRLLLGTDSVASCPDLDVLADLTVLATAHPDVPIADWLAACTHHAADALGFGTTHGRLAPGTVPGVLLLEGVHHLNDLRDGPPPRRWIVPPEPLP